MSKFIKLHKVVTLSARGIDKKLVVSKFQKEGTKRTFFSVEDINGKRLTSVMFVRKYDAEKLAYKIIKK